MRPAYASAILAIGTLCVLPAFAADVTKLRSAGALAFGAENVLFVGDTKAGGVHAYEFQAAAFDSQKDVFGGRARRSKAGSSSTRLTARSPASSASTLRMFRSTTWSCTDRASRSTYQSIVGMGRTRNP